MSAAFFSRPMAAPSLPSAVPGVWHADALGEALLQTQPTGHGTLDAQLPGGGWPIGALSEVLQALPGLHEWQLVLPALAQATAARAGAVVGVAAPFEPFGPALQAQGLAADRLCLVRADAAASALWAAEQALRCRDVLAVMAWLPQAQPAALRRLQLAAAQQQQLLWVFRPLAAAPQASPALLRLQVQQAGAGTLDAFGMEVRILKRRGPPLEQGLHLPACHPRLAQALAAQAQRRRAAQEAANHMAAPVSLTPLPSPERRAHALDRTAAAVWGG